MSPSQSATSGNEDDTANTNDTTTTNSTRKRKRTPSSWKKNKKSAAYNNGTVKKHKGRELQRCVKPRCSCKKKECKKITDAERETIFKSYWGLGETLRRQNYIVGSTQKVEKRRSKLNSTRGHPVKYFFRNGPEQTRIDVCEQFFLNTLDISRRTVHYSLKRSVHGAVRKTPAGPPSNKMPADIVQSVKSHIESINKVESHYSRSTTKRDYFEAGLSIPKLYAMFKVSEFHRPEVKESYYAKVFNENYNIGFHVPSKDTCDTCSERQKGNVIDTIESNEKFEGHIRRKDAARNHKELDKQLSDGKISVTFDLQQVLTAPRLFNGASYYKRKLNCYNLTVYELQSNRGFCYFWHEGESGRGSNEIASCVLKYLRQVDEEGKKHVVLFSDTCGGQNRNKIFSTALIHFIATSKNIEKIEHKYFESGHSQMECDSMHSAIERSFKNKEVDLPCGYIEHMKSARTRSPYTAIELVHNEFMDYKGLNDIAMKSDAFSGIINCHYFKYEKNGGNPIVVMSDEIDGEPKEIAYRKRGRPYDITNVTPLHNSEVSISKEKKNDILSLVPFLTSKQMGTLFYNSLKST